MFKDFGRRLNRDIKRRADARMEANRRITMQVGVQRGTVLYPSSFCAAGHDADFVYGRCETNSSATFVKA